MNMLHRIALTESNIYALKDPRTGEIHYIGQSIDPEKRFGQHLADTTDTPKVQWLNQLSKLGLQPEMEILESSIAASEVNNSENRWISKGIEEGWPLLNIAINETRKPNTFSEWVKNQIKSRYWTSNELARQSGISPACISMVMTGQRNPGEKFCCGVAAAFNLLPEQVFRKAGLLPPRPQADDQLNKLIAIYHVLNEDDQIFLLRIANALASAGVVTAPATVTTGGNGKE